MPLRMALYRLRSMTSAKRPSPLARLAVQLDQRHLDLGVAGCGRLLARAEQTVDVVGEAGGHAKQAVAAGRAVMGDGGLEEMAGAVQLVAVAEVGPALSGLGD